MRDGGYRGGGGGGRGRGGRGRNDNRNRRGGRGGGGGGGRGRNDRNSRGGGGYRGGGNRGGGGGRHRRGGHSDGGNQRERIQVESGHLVLIDQFMLANPQFVDQLEQLIDEEPEKKNELVQKYGGVVVQLATATYRIARDPYVFTIVIHQDGSSAEGVEITDAASEDLGKVFIDTRCLAMVDRELLDDVALLRKYQQLWLGGDDKACRDLLRDNGGAVRYGFQRFGDELGVHAVPGDNMIGLWPEHAASANTAEEDGDVDSSRGGDAVQEATSAA